MTPEQLEQMGWTQPDVIEEGDHMLLGADLLRAVGSVGQPNNGKGWRPPATSPEHVHDASRKLRAFCEGLEVERIDELLACGLVGDFRRLGEKMAERIKALKHGPPTAPPERGTRYEGDWSDRPPTRQVAAEMRTYDGHVLNGWLLPDEMEGVVRWRPLDAADADAIPEPPKPEPLRCLFPDCPGPLLYADFDEKYACRACGCELGGMKEEHVRQLAALTRGEG